jgi:hypothetical protein
VVDDAAVEETASLAMVFIWAIWRGSIIVDFISSSGFSKNIFWGQLISGF